MARIRSIHPGLATDEEFVSLTPFARIFAILLLCECDDQGVFEWKPLGLKMRIFPADDVDVTKLLAELVAANKVREYDCGGRRYGAVRNFRKFQRPQKPKAIHPLPDDMASYVGLSDSDTIPVRDQYDTPTRKSPQMEDGGCNSDTNVSAHPAPDPAKVMFDGGVRLLTGAGKTEAAARKLIGGWRKSHTDEAIIAALGAAQREGAVDPAAFIVKALGVRTREPPSAFGEGPERR